MSNCKTSDWAYILTWFNCGTAYFANLKIYIVRIIFSKLKKFEEY